MSYNEITLFTLLIRTTFTLESLTEGHLGSSATKTQIYRHFCKDLKVASLLSIDNYTSNKTLYLVLINFTRAIFLNKPKILSNY